MAFGAPQKSLKNMSTLISYVQFWVQLDPLRAPAQWPSHGRSSIDSTIEHRPKSMPPSSDPGAEAPRPPSRDHESRAEDVSSRIFVTHFCHDFEIFLSRFLSRFLSMFLSQFLSQFFSPFLSRFVSRMFVIFVTSVVICLAPASPYAGDGIAHRLGEQSLKQTEIKFENRFFCFRVILIYGKKQV